VTLRMLLHLLGEATVISVLAAFRSLTSPVEFVQAGALLVARSNVRAASLVDIDLARRLDTEPLGLTRPDDAPRLEASLMTIWEGDEEPQPRIERLARTEPLAAARSAQIEGMQEHGVEGWTRDVAPTGCALCQAWREGGRVFPPDETMEMHPNCSCLAMPIGAGEREVA
jgi:hypothetical protein